MFRVLFNLALAMAASASLIYTPPSDTPQAQQEIQLMALKDMKITKEEWDAVEQRIKDKTATNEDKELQVNYNIAVEMATISWRTQNQIVPTAQEFDEIERLAIESLTDQQQKNLQGYNAALASG